MAQRRVKSGRFRQRTRAASGPAWPCRLLLAGAVMIAVTAFPRGAPAGGNAVPGPVPARVLAVIDGDTITVRARIWLGQDVETRVRLAGVDAPELRGACPRERALAKAARERVVSAVEGATISLIDIRYDKFGGRVLASVRTAAGDDLAALLIADGLARIYEGGKRRSWCDTVATSP